MMFFNLSHFLASTFMWVFFGIAPDPRYISYIRSVGTQNPSHQLFWNFMTSFIGFMTIQSNFETRLRCAYQNLQQMLIIARLFEDIDLDNYVNHIDRFIMILHHFIQRFGAFQANLSYLSIDV